MHRRRGGLAAAAPPGGGAACSQHQLGEPVGRRKNGQHGSLHLFEAMAQRKMVFVKTGPYNISGPVRFGSVRSGAKGPLFAR